MTKPNILVRQIVEDPEDPEQLILDLGQELCDQMGWAEGDTLTWTDLKDGSWQLKKQHNEKPHSILPY
jgi:hypothetical protein